MNTELINLLWEQTTIKDKCWLWGGAKTGDGYGKVQLNMHQLNVHRLSLALYHKVNYKDNWVGCHICNNRSCWNPLHLYAGTQKENIADAIRAGHMQKRSHCRRGHEFTPENTYTDDRSRKCKTCKRMKDSARYSRRLK